MFATSILLSRQTRVAATNTSFVATKVCLSRQNSCRDKHVLFVATKVLPRQTTQPAVQVCFWLGACIPGLCLILQRQNFCHEKHAFVSTKDVFCRDKHAFVATKFIATKMILVAAPASDKIHRWQNCWLHYITVTSTCNGSSAGRRPIDQPPVHPSIHPQSGLALAELKSACSRARSRQTMP